MNKKKSKHIYAFALYDLQTLIFDISALWMLKKPISQLIMMLILCPEKGKTSVFTSISSCCKNSLAPDNVFGDSFRRKFNKFYSYVVYSVEEEKEYLLLILRFAARELKR